MIKQISVFLENKTGALGEVVKFMAENNVNLRALSIADTEDFGILRIITDNPEGTIDKIKEAGYSAKLTNVLAVEIDDKPGSFSKIVDVLSNEGISIEYTYAFLSKKADRAYIIIRADDSEKAVELLKKSGIAVSGQQDLF